MRPPKILSRARSLCHKIIHVNAHVAQVLQHVVEIIVEHELQSQRSGIGNGEGARPG